MSENQYKYTATIRQPQTAGNVKLDPKGGVLTEREYKALKKDVYGMSLLEKGLLVVVEAAGTEPNANAGAGADANAGQDEQNSGESETIPDFDSSNGNSDISRKGYENGKDRPESHAGWKPE